MLEKIGRSQRIVAPNTPVFGIILVTDEFVFYVELLFERSVSRFYSGWRIDWSVRMIYLQTL
jgi:hypothetical protein